MLSNLKFSEDVSLPQLYKFLVEIDVYFEPPLSKRVNLKEYSQKLYNKAKNYCFLDVSGDIIGALIIYTNDEKKENAYIPIVGVLENFRGLGLTKRLFIHAYEKLKKEGFKFLALETWLGGDALAYYIKNGFYIEESVYDRPGNGMSLKLKKSLSLSKEHFEFTPTPLYFAENLSADFGINLFFKRDDLFNLPGGGSKARKLNYILWKAKAQGCDSIVTAGGAQSNHVRATAIMAAKLGMSTTAVIHSEEPSEYKGNLKLTSLAGAKLRFVKMNDVKQAMDSEVVKFIEQGKKPFYIWGGGHSVEGAFSYYDSIFELKNQLNNDIEPDYIVIASGTGTTQAGIEVGIRKVFPNCKVLGVSIARDKIRGSNAVVESANYLISYLEEEIEPINEVFFDDSMMGEGYESIFPGLEETIRKVAHYEGVILDQTYSGKAFYGLEKFVQNGEIPSGSNVIFWHTGSLMNLMATNIK